MIDGTFYVESPIFITLCHNIKRGMFIFNFHFLNSSAILHHKHSGQCFYENHSKDRRHTRQTYSDITENR